MSKQILSKREAVEYLRIDDKAFDNYFNFSEEIKGFKKSNRWYFTKSVLDRWNDERKRNTVYLTIREYERCFEFALRVVYGGSSLFQRSEMEASDNWISGILAEHGLKKYLRKNYRAKIYLDNKVHPQEITPRDIIAVKKGRKKREPNLFVGVKSSKMKSVYLIADEHGMKNRSADVYVFVRVGLPRDHLFRYLRNHSFIKRANKFLKGNEQFRNIQHLEKIPIWICGFCYSKELQRKKSIPGQDFDSFRYVRNCRDLRKSGKDWKKLIAKL